MRHRRPGCDCNGQGGERQVEKNDLILISGNGGVLNYHSTTILGKRQA